MVEKADRWLMRQGGAATGKPEWILGFTGRNGGFVNGRL
jgi:hypothetical protein